MKVKRRNPIEETQLIQVFIDRERRDLPCAFNNRWAQSELIHHWNSKPFHYRARVLPKSLLSWDERVAMVRIFHLTLLQILCESHIMVRCKQQTGSFSA